MAMPTGYRRHDGVRGFPQKPNAGRVTGWVDEHAERTVGINSKGDFFFPVFLSKVLGYEQK